MVKQGSPAGPGDSQKEQWGKSRALCMEGGLAAPSRRQAEALGPSMEGGLEAPSRRQAETVGPSLPIDPQ